MALATIFLQRSKKMSAMISNNRKYRTKPIVNKIKRKAVYKIQRVEKGKVGEHKKKLPT